MFTGWFYLDKREILKSDKKIKKNIFFLIFLLKGQANQRISVERKEHVSMLAAVG